jgi:transposase
VAQAARDLDLHENVLRKWVRELSVDPQHAFPGHGQMKPEQLEIDRLRKEVAKLKAERDILKNRRRADGRLCAVETPATLACGGELPMAYWRHSTPLKKRGTWADAHLRMVTPLRR